MMHFSTSDENFPKNLLYGCKSKSSLTIFGPRGGGGGAVWHHPGGFLPITQGGRKIIQLNLVTFPENI